MSKFLESSNPLLKDGALEKVSRRSDAGRSIAGETMTIMGAVNKTLMLFGLMMITTLVSFVNPSMLNLYVGAFGGLAVYFFTYSSQSMHRYQHRYMHC